ncbi:MAG TPA: hypothetical protein VGA18_05185 [Rhodothermales bacterium]
MKPDAETDFSRFLTIFNREWNRSMLKYRPPVDFLDLGYTIMGLNEGGDVELTVTLSLHGQKVLSAHVDLPLKGSSRGQMLFNSRSAIKMAMDTLAAELRMMK